MSDMEKGEREIYRVLYGIIIVIMRKRLESIGKVNRSMQEKTNKQWNMRTLKKSMMSEAMSRF